MLTVIEATIQRFYHRSRTKHADAEEQLPPPLHAPLPSISIPLLSTLRASRQSFAADVDHLCCSASYHRKLASSVPSFSHACLPLSPSLLIGKLTADPSHPQRMTLMDDSASLPCHVAHVDASMLDQLLLLLHWNLMVTAASRPTRGAVMLEVDASDAVLLSSASPSSSLPPPLSAVPSAFRALSLHGLTQREMRRLSCASSSSTAASAASAARAPQPAPDERKQPAPQRASASRGLLHHVRGVVVAKSPIVQRRDGTFFFLQLAASSSDAAASSSSCSESSCFVLFHSAASTCWYHSLHVDHEYLIANLRVKALQLTGGKVRLVFAAVAATATSLSSASTQPSPSQQTRVFSAKAFLLPQHHPSSSSSSRHSRGGSVAGPLSNDRSPSSSSSHSSRQPSPSRRAAGASAASAGCRSTRTVSYIGCITKQVALCVYELDHGGIDNVAVSSSLPFAPLPCLRLYLTHYDCAALADGIGLRPGCVVRLEHVHPVYHSSRFLGFGCCARSDVSIVSFSPLAAICRPFHREGSGSLLWSCYQRLSLPDTALLLDTMEALLKKWGRAVKPLLLGISSGDPRSGLLQRLLDGRLCWQYRGDIYQQVLEHDDGCGIAKPHGATQPYPFFPSLSLLLQLPAVSAAFELLCSRLHSDGQSSTAWHCQTVDSQQLLLPGMVVTGFLSPSLCGFERRTHHIPPASSPPIELPARSFTSPPTPPVTSVYTGLQLSDSASPASFSLDCHVTGDWSHQQLDVCYQLQRFQLVLETVPPVGSAASITASASSLPSASSPHVVAYLCFSLADAVPLIPRVSSALSADGESRVSVGHQAVRLYITHKQTRVLPFAAVNKQQSCAAPALINSSQALLHSATQQSASSSRWTRGLSCQLHGLLVEGEGAKPSTVRVELQGLLLSLAAVLRIGSVISLSSCRPVAPGLLETAADCELEVDSSSAAKAWKRAMLPHLPVLRSIAELLSCDVNAYYAEGQRDPQLYSFSGVVLDKQFRCDPAAEDASHYRNALRRSSSAPMLQPAAAAASLPPFSSLAMTGRWWLRVRDAVLPHVVDVYLPISQRVFPAAIAPGAAVVVSGAVRKLSPSWKIFMECSHTADIALLPPPPAEPAVAVAAVSPARLLPLSLLSSFSLIPLTICQLVRRVRCRVLLVKKLAFSLSCLLCCRIVSSRVHARPGWSAGYQCGPGGCKRVELKASAQCIVDDGTATAFVLAEGDIVWRLLNLRRRDSDELRRFIADVGQFQYEHSYAQLQAAQRRRRDEDMAATSLSSDEEDEAKGKDGVDYTAFTRQKLCSLFRTVPRGRAVTLHVQQLVLSKEIEAYRAKRSRDDDVRRRQGEARAAAGGSAAEQEMDLLLSCSIGYDVMVSGAAHASKRPAGYLTLRALQCEEVDCLQEVRGMLADS